jgi:AP-1-like transcription factor
VFWILLLSSRGSSLLTRCNRQRAFRERKERHVRDLEAKLSALESSATSLATDNERLKLALQRATTENEILRATSTSSHRLSVSSSIDGNDAGGGGGGIKPLGVGPMAMGAIGAVPQGSDAPGAAAGQAALARGEGINQAGDRSSGLYDVDASERGSAVDPSLGQAGYPFPSVGAQSSAGGGRSTAFLPAAATWDLIQAHPLVKQGVVDIADVCEALRGTARCDGQGPVFREESVWKAVESARRGGGDELI